MRGGVEYSFMSCTRSKDVALAYAANQQQKGPGMVLEVQMGMVDRGADLTWVSQARYTPRCRPRDAAILRPRGTFPSLPTRHSTRTSSRSSSRH